MAKGVDKFNPAWYNKDKGKTKQPKGDVNYEKTENQHETVSQHRQL